MAGLATCRGDDRMVHRDGACKADLGAMAGIALSGTDWYRNMTGGLGHRTGTSVVAGVASTRTYRIGGRVGVLDAEPAGGGLVAGLAVAGDRGMGAGGRFAGEAISAAQVAVGALGRHGYILVERTREPACVTGFVAGVAIRNSYTRKSSIGNVIQRSTVRWRVSSAVAGRTLVGDRHLAVVPFTRAPCCRAMAAHAVDGGRNVLSGLACRGTTVVTSTAIGSGSEQGVVWLRAQPGGRGLVAALAHGLACMDGRCRPGCEPVTATQVAGGALRRHADIAVKDTRIPAGVARAVACVAVVDRDTGE